MFVIEKNIPLISLRAQYPFAQMEVGDSFLVEAPYVKRTAVAASSYARKHGWSFSLRAVSDTQHRLWRLA